MSLDTVCSLDIGASSIRALITLPDGKILSFAETPAKGFSRGIVSNLNMLSDSIEEAVSKAESAAKTRVRGLIANISGVHIRTFKSRGSIHLSDRPIEITKDIVKRCIDSAKFIAMSLDREAVHLIPEKFFIDDSMEIDEPLGLFGSKLDVDLNIITSLVSILENITKAVNIAGYKAEEIVISAAGTSLAIFSKKELEEGAVIIDVGKDVTEAALFMKEKLIDSFYFPFGSDDFTQALQNGLKIMFKEAENIRIKYGIVTKGNDNLYDESKILFTGLMDTEAVKTATTRQEISNILFPKVEEIMRDVYKKIEPFLKQSKKLPKINVVGGISKMDGFVESIEDVFAVPVHMGRIIGTKEINDISFACCLGLARYEMNKRALKQAKYVGNEGTLIGKAVSKLKQVISEYF